jgi:Prolipoprotein diacylglyceryltransferase
LWFLRNKVKFTGFIFFLYALLMSIERFLIEFIRVNPRYDFLGMSLSQAQYISIGVFLAGCVGLYYWYNRRDRPVIMQAPS